MTNFTTLRGAHVAAVCLGATVLGGSHAAAQNVINSNTTIRSALCVGLDCANSESYGADSIRLKENNLRIHFEDTSVGSFPSTDWRLIANSNSNGGANMFVIQDATANRNIFTVTGGAPANSLFINSSGRVGFKTPTPAVDIHTRSGNTPTLRLEQDGSSGFTPQTWDVAGNESVFFIRDVTNSSALPVRIYPGSENNNFFAIRNARLGLGTINPQDNLHIVSSGNTSVRLETTGASAARWSVGTIASNGLFVVNDLVANAFPLRIQAGTPTATLDLRANGSVRIAGLPNCAALQTDSIGNLTCTAGGSAPAESANAASSVAVRAGTPDSTARTATGAADASTPERPSSGPTDTESETCTPGDMAGNWSLIGTNIERFGANSVLWCDVQLTQAQNRSKTSYSISGACRSHVPNVSTPEEFTVDGNGSLTATAACRIGGSFRIKQGSAVVTTARILEGRIEGPAGKKTRAVALSRLPRGRASAIQTFVLQR